MPFTCPSCDKQLARSDSLRRHQELVHARPMLPYHNQHNTSAQTSLKRSHEEVEEVEEPETPKKIRKRCKYFYPIASDAWENTYDKFEKALKNQSSDEDENDAEDIAFAEMEDKHEKAFFNVYKDFLVKSLYTRKSRLHQKVLDHAMELHNLDVPAKDAVKMSVRKHRDDFDAPKFVRHAATEDDSEEETDEEDRSSEISEDQVNDDCYTQSSNSGTSESDQESTTSSQEKHTATDDSQDSAA